MIIKVQISIYSSDGVQSCLAYDESRTFEYQGPAEPDILEKMKGRLKAYFYAITMDNTLLITGEAPWQNW